MAKQAVLWLLLLAVLLIVGCSATESDDSDTTKSEEDDMTSHDDSEEDETDNEEDLPFLDNSPTFTEGWVQDSGEIEHGKKVVNGVVMIEEIDSDKVQLKVTSWAELYDPVHRKSFPLYFEDMNGEDLPAGLETGARMQVKGRKITLDNMHSEAERRHHGFAVTEKSVIFGVAGEGDDFLNDFALSNPMPAFESKDKTGRDDPMGPMVNYLSDSEANEESKSEEEDEDSDEIKSAVFSLENIPIPPIPSDGKMKIGVVLVTFSTSEKVHPWNTPAKKDIARKILIDNKSNSIRRILAETAFDWITITGGQTFGPITIDADVNVCSGIKWWDKTKKAVTAAKLSQTIKGYDIVIYVSPPLPCKWGGMGLLHSFRKQYNFIFLTTKSSLKTWAHEIGHVLSMRHSPKDKDGDGLPDKGYVYGDSTSMMGKGKAGFSGPHREMAGWFSRVPKSVRHTSYAELDKLPNGLTVRLAALDLSGKGKFSSIYPRLVMVRKDGETKARRKRWEASSLKSPDAPPHMAKYLYQDYWYLEYRRKVPKTDKTSITKKWEMKLNSLYQNHVIVRSCYRGVSPKEELNGGQYVFFNGKAPLRGGWSSPDARIGIKVQPVTGSRNLYVDVTIFTKKK